MVKAPSRYIQTVYSLLTYHNPCNSPPPPPPPPFQTAPLPLFCVIPFQPSSHCAYTAQTTPGHILQKLTQMCLTLSTNVGCVLQPKDCETVVLFLKDLNLPKPDKWGTNQLPSFIQQVRSGGGEELFIHDYTLCATMCK